jgi:hypothetical protein
MRQQEKMPPRAIDAAVKNAKSSGIPLISVLLAILVFCCSEKGAALDPTSFTEEGGERPPKWVSAPSTIEGTDPDRSGEAFAEEEAPESRIESQTNWPQDQVIVVGQTTG